MGRPIQIGQLPTERQREILYSRLIAETHADLRNVFRMRERSL